MDLDFANDSFEKLETVLQMEFKNVFIAHKSDNCEVLDFFNAMKIQGKNLSFCYDRSPDFFKFLEYHSENYFVLCIKNELGKICGVGTLTIRDGYIDRRVEKIGYFGDLRVTSNRKTAVLWRKVYTFLLSNKSKIKELKDVKCFYTAVVDSNPDSSANLIFNKRGGFNYIPVAPYKMLNVFTKKLLRKPKKLFKVSEVYAENWKKLLDFYKKEESKIPSGYLFSSEIIQRLKKWDRFTKDDFRVIESDGKVIAAWSYWSPRRAKRIQLSTIKGWLKWILKIGSIFVKTIPKPEGELKILYVTNLVIEESIGREKLIEIYKTIMHDGLTEKNKRDYAILCLCYFKALELDKAFKDFFIQSLDMKVFEVSKDHLPIRNWSRYGFEIGLV